ncbi:type III ribulose-bisphosphate carboxylase [bacterium]|nr:type III ribulose-bisphosphate carboxylase [bacterium]
MKYQDNLQYYDPDYTPKDSDVICLYKYDTIEGIPFEEGAEQITAESSIGTWTKISTMNDEIAHKLKPHVFKMNKEKKLVHIAYPIELFETNNMSGILSSVCGNILGMKILSTLRICDIKFPKEIVEQYPGPAHGIEGIRELTKVTDRPFTGTIVKPKVGLTSEQHSQVGYQAWSGIDGQGLDIVKDDENLTSQAFNDFDTRMKLTLAMRDKAEKETGHKKLYLANITHSNFDEMMRRSDLVKSLGGEVCMLDVVTLGFSAVETYRRKNTGQIIHAHRAMHGAITRQPGFTISMLLLAKIYRMLGVDLLHIGTAGAGKMEGGAREVLTIVDAIEHDSVKADEEMNTLGQEWYGMKPVLAVASGGLQPAKIPVVIERMGKDVVCQMGGGCHGHPDGTAAGAQAIVQAVDAAMKGISIEEYAKSHEALQKAVDKWGL